MSKRKIELGDFQTPRILADEVCQLLLDRGIRPASVVEPTCGCGTFVLSTLDAFATIATGSAVDVSNDYLAILEQELCQRNERRIALAKADFFATNWSSIIQGLPQPVLVIGNPPWVTNSTLSSLGSNNIPRKANFQGYRGIDALTGKSNFDIAEWMLLKLIGALTEVEGILAMLCKTSVARKVLRYCWKSGVKVGGFEIRRIDAMEFFGAAVDACLFLAVSGADDGDMECAVYDSIRGSEPSQVIAFRQGTVIADMDSFQRWQHLRAARPTQWRSGVKHDCSKIMELYPVDGSYRNGFGELVCLEPEYLYPMLKSSEIANGLRPTRRMIVTQRRMGEDTSVIKNNAKKTWEYLLTHTNELDGRASSIYKNKPRFSIFGVGDYTFAPYKVAISGFYKQLIFKVVESFEGKPVVLDDTSYFLPFESRDDAEEVAAALNSSIAREFFNTYIFWDSKRPITIDVLKLLDIDKLMLELTKCPC